MKLNSIEQKKTKFHKKAGDTIQGYVPCTSITLRAYPFGISCSTSHLLGSKTRTSPTLKHPEFCQTPPALRPSCFGKLPKLCLTFSALLRKQSQEHSLRKQEEPGVEASPTYRQRPSDALTNHSTPFPHCPDLTPWDGCFLSL